MGDIVIQIEKIEALFIKAAYQQAYEALLILCKPYSDFARSSQSILSRYNDYCKDIETGVIPLSEKHIRKQEMANSYQMCMKRFKECHVSHNKTSCIYQSEADSLREHRNRIRRTKMKIEDEYSECDDPHKIGMFEKILQEIRHILERFEYLLKHFSEVSQYERV